ncbi:MAG: ABC transporter ATP-binding protein [Pirellulaceae bacterium]
MNISSSTTAAVELVDLWKHFRRAEAVKGLNLQIPPGCVFGLIGPNGAGKSTTIKMLMGILRPTRGHARVLGLDVLAQGLELRQRVGYVPESHQIYRWMRVAEVIHFCRAHFRTWNAPLCHEMLALFQLNPQQKVRHLSKGMLGKLALLLAIAHEPELLILDEPMAGLDPLAREEFLDGVLRTICQRQQTVLFCTHLLDDIQRLADVVGIMYDGRLLVHRKIDELLASTKRIRATLIDGQQPGVPPGGVIWQRIIGREWLVTVKDFSIEKVEQLRAQNPVEHVEVIDLGLEDVFKDIVRGQRAAS